MQKVNKCAEPEYFKDFKKKKQPRNWNELPSEISLQLRADLLAEQNKYCPYCERYIKEENPSHIEHIYPRNPQSPLKRSLEKEFDYQNLIASCQSKKTCGTAKGNEFDEQLFINPTSEEPMDFLTHKEDSGEIQSLQNNQKGIYTTKILKLNDKTLVESRKAWHLQLSSLSGSSKEELNENLRWLLKMNPNPNFPSIIKYHLENYDELGNCEKRRYDRS